MLPVRILRRRLRIPQNLINAIQRPGPHSRSGLLWPVVALSRDHHQAPFEVGLQIAHDTRPTDAEHLTGLAKARPLYSEPAHVRVARDRQRAGAADARGRRTTTETSPMARLVPTPLERFATAIIPVWWRGGWGRGVCVCIAGGLY